MEMLFSHHSIFVPPNSRHRLRDILSRLLFLFLDGEFPRRLGFSSLHLDDVRAGLDLFLA